MAQIQGDEQLGPAPIQNKMLDMGGLPDRYWALWFQNIFKRLGNLTSASGTWTPTFGSISGVINASGSWRSIGNQVFWQVVLAVPGSADLTGGHFDLPVQAATPGTFAAVRTDVFQDFGNGVVTGVTGYLPAIAFSSGTVVLSGRYVR